jgi:hypothetical protein
MSAEQEQHNFDVFRECLSEMLIQRLSVPQKPARKRAGKERTVSKPKGARKQQEVAPDVPANDASAPDADELADFIEVCNGLARTFNALYLLPLQYLSAEIFPALPPSLRSLNHLALTETPSLSDVYEDPLPTNTVEAITSTIPISAAESLVSYVLPSSAIQEAPSTAIMPIMTDVLNNYVSSVTKPPPPPSSTRPVSNECEICGRTQLPLTYHHLIPRAVHAKVLKRNWHSKEKLDSVAWLCRACHSFVHRCASHEELAREWFTVERLLERDDVQAFAGWVGKVRWKSR